MDKETEKWNPVELGIAALVGFAAIMIIAQIVRYFVNK